MQWRHSGSPHPKPKKSDCKNLPEKLSPGSIGIKKASSSLIILSSKGPNYQRGVLLISVDAIEGHFEGKTPQGVKVTKGDLLMHDNAPAHRALVTHKKLAYLGFQCLDHPPYSPDLAPSDYHLLLGTEKNN